MVAVVLSGRGAPSLRASRLNLKFAIEVGVLLLSLKSIATSIVTELVFAARAPRGIMPINKSNVINRAAAPFLNLSSFI
jgi:hypothetical protein